MRILGVLGGKIDLSGCSARRCRQCLSNFFALLELLRIEGRVQQLIQALCFNAKHGFLRRNPSLIYKVAGNLNGSLRGALAVSRLQEKQLALLDGKFHVLHVAVMVFQTVGDVHKLLVALWQIFCELGNRLRRADACDNIFTLRVDQILTKNTLFTGGRVAGKRDAGAGRVAHVAEYHGLNVDSGAPIARNVIHAAVYNCTRIVPRAEYRLDSLHELYLWILRELCAHFFRINCFIPCDDFFEIVRSQIGIIFCALRVFDLRQDALKERFAHLHDDIREHLDKPAIRIVGKPRIAGFLGEALYRDIVQAQIQNSIHHARHRCPRAGTHGYQQRIRFIAELLAALLLQYSERRKNLLLNLLRNLLALCIVIGACLRRYRKAVWNRQPQIGHLGKVCALAAEQRTHISISLMKFIHPFFHTCFLPFLDICPSLSPAGRCPTIICHVP